MRPDRRRNIYEEEQAWHSCAICGYEFGNIVHTYYIEEEEEEEEEEVVVVVVGTSLETSFTLVTPWRW